MDSGEISFALLAIVNQDCYTFAGYSNYISKAKNRVLMSTNSEKSSPSISFENTGVAFASRSDRQLLKMYYLFWLMNHSWLVSIGVFFIKLALMLRLPVQRVVKNTVFEHFCGGETIGECQQVINALGSAGIGTILDYSIEGEETNASYDATLTEILRTIDLAARSEYVPFSVFKVTGIAPADLLEKQQGGQQLTETETEVLERSKERMDQLCKAASERKVGIFVDAEESWIQETIDSWTYEMMEKYNKTEAIVYNTFQLYRQDAFQNLTDAVLKAREKGYQLGAKLVRGAYIEKEKLRAMEHNYADPLHNTKEDTDQDYNKAILYSLGNLDYMSVCLGTHNEYSTLYCTELMQQMGISINDKRIWFAQLLGMSDNISYNMADAGYNAAKYVPYGPVESVMPYLFRRAAENTSIAGQSSREFLLVKKELERRKSK